MAVDASDFDRYSQVKVSIYLVKVACSCFVYNDV